MVESSIRLMGWAGMKVPVNSKEPGNEFVTFGKQTINRNNCGPLKKVTIDRPSMYLYLIRTSPESIENNKQIAVSK